MIRSATGRDSNPVRTWVRAPGVVCLLLLLSACATTEAPQLDQLVTPLHLPEGSLTVQDSEAQVSTPELLAIDEDMRRFVQKYTGRVRSERQRLHMLHRAVRNPGLLGMEYEPFAEGGAIETFHRGSANCLSYANMFVALAREAGLDAQYQWLEVRPEWSRMGGRVAVRLHVNVVVDTERGDQFMVDIDPLQSQDVTGSRRLSDADAQALHHNNIAMGALAEERLGEAWLQVVRALQLAPEMTHLWVNLGAIYRLAGQHPEAERSYLQALELDSGDRSAMTNLVALYDMDGREEERDMWASRVNRYRETNPFYHAWLGEQAAQEDDWSRARDHFERALSLSPTESGLLYASGVVAYKLGDLDTARDYLNQAIATATLYSDQANYRLQLQAVESERGEEGI